MNGEHGGGGGGGGQCGLTSLLPMSCRGRAAAFARDLHTRLRSLGTTSDDEQPENGWLRDQPAPTAHPRHSPVSPREFDTFYDFELECGSPSSPVDEYEAPQFSSRNNEDQEPPFYDVDTEPIEPEHQQSKSPPKKTKPNGFTFSTAFFTDSSPVKSIPSPRENGHAEKQLYSPITFEGCARHNSQDEIDFGVIAKEKEDNICLFNSINMGLETLSIGKSVVDSDSEFESAKSEPSEEVDEVELNESKLENDITEDISLLDDNDIPVTVEQEIESEIIENKLSNGVVEIVTSDPTSEIIMSPAAEINPSLLSIELTEEDCEEEDDKPQRVRRCSSLKTGKTPPGTPGRKKIVRFADVLGLDLADVKTFLDEIPVIPKSAYDDLTGADLVAASPPSSRAPLRLGGLTLAPLFQVPRDLSDKLAKLNVCLESATVGDGVHLTVCGSVRVRNLDFHKTVHIRYSMNRWKTFTDLQATYVPGTCDGFSEKFQFNLYVPCISSGQRLEFAVRFQCKGQQFWDSNSGVNYCFDCLALGTGFNSAQTGPLHPTTDWHPSFY